MGSQKGLGLYRNVYVYDQDQDLLDWVHKTSEAPEQHLKSTLYIKKLQYVGVNKQSLWWQILKMQIYDETTNVLSIPASWYFS